MKFTDGYWQMRQGMTPHFPNQVHETVTESDALVILAATKRITARGDTIDQPLLTFRFSAPMEDVIRVQIFHHKGVQLREPNFLLSDQPFLLPEITDNEEWATLTSGQLSVRIQKGPEWLVEFKAGDRVLTSSAWRAMGFVDTPDGRFIHEQLNIGVGECVYGFGERFTAFVKNGQMIDIWNEDGGTSSEQAYKNIPFYLTNRGYGVFVNHPGRVSFEVASEKVERVQFSVPGEVLDYFVIYGTTPKDVINRYTTLTGRPALPPAWSFGLWLSTSFSTEYDEEKVIALIDAMAAHEIPLNVFHFDSFWMREFNWCDFKWDKRYFPDPEKMLKRLKERFLHICLWINPYIAQQSVLFDEAMAAGYLLKKANGDVWQWDKWQAGMGILDFTNPGARQWFKSKLRILLEMGVDTFKTDFGERVPTDVVYYDGSDPTRMHNFYAYLYNQTVFELLQEQRGEGEAVVFARSATTGSQKFPVHWGGDSTATFESMAESLRAGLSLGLSGFGFWSHDIGGFEQSASADVYKRWVAFGLLSSHSRLHGSSSYRVPWVYDEESVKVLAKFTRLKCSLMPYLYHAACQAHENGTPMLRAMILEFPYDPGCFNLDQQYMLGDSLLVAPVMNYEGIATFYVPDGSWTNLLDGRTVVGPRWVQETHDFLSLPVLVRPNSIIPMGGRTDRPDYDYSDNITLRIYQLGIGKNAQVVVPGLKGTDETIIYVTNDEGFISIRREGNPKAWKVLLVNNQAVKLGKYGTRIPQGTLFTPDEEDNSLQIALQSS